MLALLSSELICNTTAGQVLHLLAGKEWLDDSQAALSPVLSNRSCTSAVLLCLALGLP